VTDGGQAGNTREKAGTSTFTSRFMRLSGRFQGHFSQYELEVMHLLILMHQAPFGNAGILFAFVLILGDEGDGCALIFCTQQARTK
jgi:hypothetical protein